MPPSLHPALENKHFVPPGISFSGGSRSPAELGTACGVELVGWIDPKATSLLIFPLFSFPLPNPGLPCIASVLFSAMSLIVDQTQKPSTRPTPGLQVPWELWSEEIKVLVAFSPNCCYALASCSILLLQSIIEHFQSSRSVYHKVFVSVSWQVMFQPVPESHKLISGSVTNPCLLVSVTLFRSPHNLHPRAVCGVYRVLLLQQLETRGGSL